MSEIEAIGREWAWAWSGANAHEQRSGDDGDSQGNYRTFDADALIARYRNCETVITHFHPSSAREAAIRALVIADHIHIKDTDFVLNAPIGELGRYGYSNRDYLCALAGTSAAVLLDELLVAANEPGQNDVTTIRVLVAELTSAWHGRDLRPSISSIFG